MIGQTSLFDSPKPARPDLSVGTRMLLDESGYVGTIVAVAHRSAIVQWREVSPSGEMVRRSIARSLDRLRLTQAEQAVAS